MENVHPIRDIYANLEDEIKTILCGSLKEGIFISLLRAALAKNYEFNVMVNREASEANPFFAMASLRGMCEDIIVLGFLKTFRPDEREKVSETLLKLKVADALDAQREFFNSQRSFQPVFDSRHGATIEELKSQLKNIVRRYFPLKGDNNFPTTKQMAVSQNLLYFYNYLYAATSRLVHFEPTVLLRMGWGDGDSTETKMQFSTSNFEKYYTEFNIVYGSYLFLMFYDKFADELTFTAEFSQYAQELKNNLDKMLRWPEIVTFEEMNQKPPSSLLYLLARSSHSINEAGSNVEQG